MKLLGTTVKPKSPFFTLQCKSAGGGKPVILEDLFPTIVVFKEVRLQSRRQLTRHCAAAARPRRPSSRHHSGAPTAL